MRGEAAGGVVSTADIDAALKFLDYTMTQEHGAWVIENLTEGQTYFFRDGVPRRIDFGLDLRRVDDAEAAETTPADLYAKGS